MADDAMPTAGAGAGSGAGAGAGAVSRDGRAARVWATSALPCAVTRLSHSLVNAFAVSPHWLSTGNPTGVCLLDTPLEDGALQAIANEVNTSETAFLTPEAPSKVSASETSPYATATRFKLRWFSRHGEVPLCGHGTLAAGGVLFYVEGNSADAVTFDTLSGELGASRSAAGPDRVQLRMPRNTAVEVAVDGAVAQLRDIVVGTTPLKPGGVLYCEATTQLLFVLAPTCTRADLEALSPDFDAMLAVPQSPDQPIKGVSVSLQAAPTDKVDVLERYFTPWHGNNESYANGSSQTCLTPYWAQQLGKPSLTALMCSQRTGHMGLRDCGTYVALDGAVFPAVEGGTVNVPQAVATPPPSKSS